MGTLMPNHLVTCPLDESHRIIKSRMQFHLVKCVKNHSLKNKIRCPWNTLHIVDRFEYLEHCNSKCEDLVNVMGTHIVATHSLNDDTEHSPAAVPIDTSSPPMNGEDWNNDAPVATYDPIRMTEGRAVFRTCIGLSKAQRKKFRQEERKRHQELENELPIQIKPSTSKPKEEEKLTPRLPRKPQAAVAGSVIDEHTKYAKVPSNLRRPHAPSPALLCSALDDASDDQCTSTAFESETDDATDSDVNSYASSRVSRPASFAAYCRSAKKSKEKAASSMSATEVPDSTMEDLSEQLAELETMEKGINEKKAALLQKMSQADKKSNTTDTSVNSEPAKIETSAEASTSKKVEASVLRPENGVIKSKRTCAANFDRKPVQHTPPVAAFGRGIVIDIDNSKVRKPGAKRNENARENDGKENVSPSLINSEGKEKNQSSFISYSQAASKKM